MQQTSNGATEKLIPSSLCTEWQNHVHAYNLVCFVNKQNQIQYHTIHIYATQHSLCVECDEKKKIIHNSRVVKLDKIMRKNKQMYDHLMSTK